MHSSGAPLPLHNDPIIKQLFQFKRVHLAPGASYTWHVQLSSRTLSVVDRQTGDLMSVPGVYDVVITNGVQETARASVAVRGAPVVMESFPDGM